MKVLFAHNAYRQRGGEDAVVAAERALLAEHGHTVSLLSASNDALSGFPSRIGAALRAPHSPAARDALAHRLADERPDVVHVHNFFPLLTPSLYDACRAAGVAVVQTLHNYRLICPAATLTRAGKPCELCVTGSAYQAVLHGCYRGSRLGTLAVARMVEQHRKRGTWRDHVDRFIALSRFAKRKFVEGGLPAAKIAVKPNFFVERHEGGASPTRREGALFVGRLSAEKGLRTLIGAWRGVDAPLRVAGDGPLLDDLRAAAPPAVSVLGPLTAAEVAAEMRRASFLVLPSECYEGFPMVVAEAYGRALPVIASRLGSLAEIVEDGVTGVHFTAGDGADLAAKVRRAAASADEMRRMGAAARARYEERYTAGANYRMLWAVYEQAIAAAQVRSGVDADAAMVAAGA
ncbi:MAG: glycosyltransferase [Alphaproteobacteria bacterium]